MRMQKPSYYQASKSNHFVYHRLTTSTALQNRANRQKEGVGHSSSIYHRYRRQRQSNNKHSPSPPIIPSPITTQRNPKPNQFFFLPIPTKQNKTRSALLLPRCKRIKIKGKKMHHVVIVVMIIKRR